MPQETNLNVYPYFDDYSTVDYHRVLFKPGYPVQARELTTLQSILQKQIERFGTHIFTDGSKVLGGELSYNNRLDYVILENLYFGNDVNNIIKALNGTIIFGKTSGVRAEIIFSISSRNSYIGSTTLYVKYISPGTDSARSERFISGEVLAVESNFPTDGQSVSLSNGVQLSLAAGEGFCLTRNFDATGLASAATIENGTFFIRGFFVNVNFSTILLDQYKNKGNFKVGLRVKEKIITSDQDPSLNDNSNGFSNFAAPGADRFKVSARLDKVGLNDNSSNDFITISEIRDGVEITSRNLTQYSEISEEFARRTFDESGNYYVKSPKLVLKETLNNFKGNNGIFPPDRETYNGNTPSESLGTYVVSPTKAYVLGFEVKTIGSTYLDFKKPRTTKTLEKQSINYFTGPTYTLNRVYGSPKVGFSDYYISLQQDRVGSDQTIASGKEIGLARVYDFALESGSYSSNFPDSNEWDLSLYDVQTYTEITLNEPITLQTPTRIKGNSSGAVAYLRYDVSNSGIITAYNSSGNFVIGETFTFDGIDNTRISTSVTSYSPSDVKSVYGSDTAGTYVFSADVKQNTSIDVGFVGITSADILGQSFVTSADYDFSNSLKINSLVSFTNPGSQVPNYSKVVNISSAGIRIENIETVAGVCSGVLPNTGISPSDFKILKSSYQRSSDNTLYTRLPKANIRSVDLTDSDLIVRKQYDVVVTAGQLTQAAGDDLIFLPFDEERYCLTNSNGVTEELTPDKIDISASTSITIKGLSNDGNARLIATLKKTNISSKVKNRNRVNSIIVNKSKYVSSGIGTTTLNDGLQYGNYAYGTRVQDEEICLNQCDVNKIVGIYESDNISDPTLPSIIFSSLDGSSGTTSDLILGEEFFGSVSNCVGVLVEKASNLKIAYSKLSTPAIIPGEVLTFKDSGINAVVSSTDPGDKDITSSYILKTEQKNTLYDYSKIVRKENKKEPSKRIKIVFESASFSDSDSGDITTVNSYDQFDFCNILKTNGIRNSDVIDIRPRVPQYTVAENTRSPFEFLGRSISTSKNSSKHILASDEAFIANISFYLPRIDTIYLSKDGKFQLKLGEPSESPKKAQPIENSIEVAKIELPSYLCDVKDAKITLTDYKRYKMSDIKKLEDRIRNLEYYTSLSILESETSNLQITDADGLNRFKSGFFVDDFSTTRNQKKVVGTKNSIDIKNAELRPSHYSTQIDLNYYGFTPTFNASTDYRFVGTGIPGLAFDKNTIRTGQLLTLKYQQVPEIIQPYASQVTCAAPYTTSEFNGSLELFPSSDTWTDQIRVEPLVVNAEGDFVKTELDLEDEGFDQQSGFSPAVYNSWEVIWTGETVTETSQEVTVGNEIILEEYEQVTQTGTQTRTGTIKIAKESFETTSFGDQVLNSTVIPYMRSRNIEFTGRKLKPFTQLYSFFDGRDVTKYIMPKLVQVTMLDGAFVVGETVTGYSGDGYKLANGSGDVSATICTPLPTFTARVAQQNHKFGPYDSPTKTVQKNPYDRNLILPSTYSSSSTILNIDTYSLADKSQGEYYSKPEVGMVLRGRISGATARVTSLDLYTDQIGDVIGCFYIPNPNVDVNPKFETGSKVFKVTSSSTNSLILGTVSTAAEKTYFAQGTLDTVQENQIIIRNADVVTEMVTETQDVTQVGDNELVGSTVIGTIEPPYHEPEEQIPVSTTGYYPTTGSDEPPPPPVVPTQQAPVQQSITIVNQLGPNLGQQGANRLNELLSLANLPQNAYQSMDYYDALSLFNQAIDARPDLAPYWEYSEYTETGTYPTTTNTEPKTIQGAILAAEANPASSIYNPTNLPSSFIGASTTSGGGGGGGNGGGGGGGIAPVPFAGGTISLDTSSGLVITNAPSGGGGGGNNKPANNNKPSKKKEKEKQKQKACADILKSTGVDLCQ